jgi:hypothetical protein
MVTFGDMAEALYQLQKRYTFYYNPSEREIFEEAKRRKALLPRLKSYVSELTTL